MTEKQMESLVDEFLEIRMRSGRPWQAQVMLSDFGFWVEAYVREECGKICDAYGMPDGTSETARVIGEAIRTKKSLWRKRKNRGA
jgi:hypothetical protein